MAGGNWLLFCEDCTKRNRKKGKETPCDTCRPKLLPDNEEILGIITEYRTLLIKTGESGNSIDSNSIKMVLEMEELKERKLNTRKILLYYNIMRNKIEEYKKEENRKNGKRC
jgi:hypothetical protein